MLVCVVLCAALRLMLDVMPVCVALRVLYRVSFWRRCRVCESARALRRREERVPAGLRPREGGPRRAARAR
eukprot:6180911-Pleurochrysis_carterae.AAC.1